MTSEELYICYMHDQLGWQQRLHNLKRASNKLSMASGKSGLTELEGEGLVKRFAYTFELAWNCLKDFLTYQGRTELRGPRDVIMESVAAGLITNGQVWMDMMRSRNLTSHIYNETLAQEIVQDILSRYHVQFPLLIQTLEKEI